MTEISIGGLPLEALAEMANEAAELAERDMVSAVGRAWDCGRYLLAAKQQVPHGQASLVGLEACGSPDVPVEVSGVGHGVACVHAHMLAVSASRRCASMPSGL